MMMASPLLEIAHDATLQTRRPRSLQFLAVDPVPATASPAASSTLCTTLIEHEIDLPSLEARYKNDEVGAPAY